MFQRTKIFSGLLLAFGSAMLLGAPPAFAQDSGDPGVQRVEVTGSSIKRIAAEGALPIQTLTAEDIKRTGATSVTDLMQSLPAMQGFTTTSQSVNGGGFGITTASMHDIGSKYTLVLLNGHRMAPWNAGSEVNLSTIPIAAIERIEVLTDGASALYGADAIAGVVNFILKKNTTAGEFDISGDVPQKTGGKSTATSISKGFGNLDSDRYNVLLAASFNIQQSLEAKDRSFSKTGRLKFKDAYGNQSVDLVSDYSAPSNATVNLSNGQVITVNPYRLTNGSCAPGSFAATGQGDGRCLTDDAATVQDIPKSKLATALASGRFEINSKTSLFAELLVSDFQIDPAFSAVAQTLPVSNALISKDIDPLLSGLGYDPSVTATSATMNMRLNGTGNRQDRFETKTFHSVLGTDFTIGNFDSTISLIHSQNHWQDILLSGYASSNAVGQLIDDGTFDPLTGTGSSSVASATLHQMLEQAWSVLDMVQARTSTTLGSLSGGDLALAAGVDVSRQKFADHPSAIEQGPNSLQPDYTDTVLGGFSGSLPYDSSRKSWGVFTELNAPISKELELDASARYDDYGAVENKDGFDTVGDFTGSTTQGKKSSSMTYKMSALLRPTKEILLRGSLGTGFKVPVLTDISELLQYYGATGIHSCPPGLSAAKAAYCDSVPRSYDWEVGGNSASDSSALRPEHSTQWTLGFRIEPGSALSFGADLWTVRIKDQINSVTEDAAFANGAQYDSLFTVITDPISGVKTLTFLNVPTNTGNAFYQGVDFDGESHLTTPLGKLSLRGHATYMLRADYQTPGTAGYINSMSKVGTDGQVTFRYQVDLSATLQHGLFEYTLAGHYKPGYKDDTTAYCYDTSNGFSGDSSGCSVDSPNRRVSAYALFDFQTKYDVTGDLSITGGIKNLFDRNPPFTLNDQLGTGSARGYDGRYTNPLGRTFYASANYKF